MQARQNLEETRWLLELAEKHPFIKGVVGWVDLRSDRLSEQLERFAQHPKLVGVRHVVHDEPDDHFMLRPEFRRGIAQLLDFNLTYDLLLFPKHLKVAVQLVEEFPQQPFVLDHIAKPGIAEAINLSLARRSCANWRQFPNVFCKLSGMVTEAKWKQWQPCRLSPLPGRRLRSIRSHPPHDRFRLAGLHAVGQSMQPVMNIVMDYVTGRSRSRDPR